MNRIMIAALTLALAACNEETICAQGDALCGGVCKSVAIDEANCGACGVACRADQTCDAGSCVCELGTTDCGGTCFDLSTSPAHCGACGNDCAAGLDGPRCATVGGQTSCVETCPGGLVDCDGACVDVASDRLNCGACGARCGRAEACRGGTCAPEVYVACFATDDLRPASRDLRAGLARPAGDGPIALAFEDGRVWAANSISHSLSSFATDLGDGREIALAGSDFEALAAHGGRLFVSNAGPGTLVVYDPVAGRVADEVVLGDGSGVNPRGVAFVGDRAYVALYGTNPSSGGQEIVAIDFAGLDACATPPCGEIVGRISVLAAADAGGLPFPSAVVARDATVYVALANLKLGEWGYYTDPAGHGKLAVIDSAHGDAVSYVDLGPGCTNPGALALLGDALWVACGGTGNVLPVDLSAASPAPGEAVSAGVSAPGKLAFCGESGYVTDQWSGAVVRFDPSGVEAAASAVVCPTSEAGWAWAADVACAQ
jgi:hypothetical protein